MALLSLWRIQQCRNAQPNLVQLQTHYMYNLLSTTCYRRLIIA